MTDYIERDAALRIVRGFCHSANIESEIERLPAADVRPVVHARWIEDGDNQPISCDKVYCCSNCRGSRRFETQFTPFCPNCGADMREVPHDN